MCKSVGFSSEFSGTIFNDIIKAGKIFGPLGLLLGEEFCGIEVFEGFVICNNLNLVYRSLKVGTPFLESCKDCKEFFIMDFISSTWWVTWFLRRRQQGGFCWYWD